jgi:hypothetical protein
MRIKVVREDLHALLHLLCDMRLELVERAKVANLVIALDLDESAGDKTLGSVKVKKRQVCPFEANFVTDLLGLLPQRPVEIEVRIQRDDDLLCEDALVLKVHARERKAKRLCTLRGGRNQLQRKSTRQRTQLVEDSYGMTALGLEPVSLKDRANHGLELGHGTGRDHESMPNTAKHLWRVVDEVVRSPWLPAMVEELNTHIPVEGEHPVAHLVHLVE